MSKFEKRVVTGAIIAMGLVMLWAFHTMMSSMNGDFCEKEVNACAISDSQRAR